MSEPIPPVRHALPPEPFLAATAQVNEWRGRCLDAFTRTETLATECLAAMALSNDGKNAVDLPHLVGQRFEALSTAIAPAGPFAEQGSMAFARLEQFRGYMELRNMLCHGTSKVTLDLHGRWTVVLRLVSFRSRRVVRDHIALMQAEASEIGDDIVRTSRQLCSQLGQLRFDLRPKS